MRVRRELLGAALVSAAVGLTGCGKNDRDQVRDKVDQLVKSISDRDYTTICKQVLAPALLRHLAAGGIQCEQAMQIGFGGVSDPGLAIGRIDVHGSSASVVTITTAQGQEASLDAIELIKTGAGWRVSGLGTPTFPRPKGGAATTTPTTPTSSTATTKVAPIHQVSPSKPPTKAKTKK